MISTVLLAIIFPVISIVLFKEFEKQEVDSFSAIVFNYLGAIFIGLGIFITPEQFIETPQQPWFVPAIIMGILFILNFYLIAKTTIYHGISMATFANKISLIIPIVFTILYFAEPATWSKITGVLLALVSIYLLTLYDSKKTGDKLTLFPLFVFICTGIAETFINFSQKIYLSNEGDLSYFVIGSFACSFMLGFTLLLFRAKLINMRNVLAGLILSLPNTFGIYFFIKALNQSDDSSSVLPIINIGALVLAVVLGILLYKEKFSFSKLGGLLLVFLSIILLSI